MTGEVKDRNPLAAGLLSLLMPGLGQLYNGQPRKGLFLFLSSFPLLFLSVSLFDTFSGLLTAITAMLGYLALCVGDAAFVARKRRHYNLRRYNRGWLYALLILVNAGAGAALDMYLSASLYESFYVPSESMEPTLVAGDRFMGRVLGNGEAVRRGAVAVFHPPGQDGVYYVKRVVGVPGDVVDMKGGVVCINGARMKSGPSALAGGEGTVIRDLKAYRLGPDEYWVMGDNREHSFDSRFFGPVKRGRIGYGGLYLFWAVPTAEKGWTERIGGTLNR